MPVIRISEQTMERLKQWAEPLTDTADSALVHGMTVVTRNVHHLAPTGALCIDPFEPADDSLEPTDQSAQQHPLPWLNL